MSSKNVNHATSSDNRNAIVLPAKPRHDSESDDEDEETEILPPHSKPKPKPRIKLKGSQSLMNFNDSALTESAGGYNQAFPDIIRSPTLREKMFQKYFQSPSQTVIEDYLCAYSRVILYQGTMFVTNRSICFHSKLLPKRTIQIDFNNVSLIKKSKTAKVIPNAVSIYVEDGRCYVFCSLLSRSSTFSLLMDIWAKNRPLPPKNRLESDSSRSNTSTQSEDGDSKVVVTSFSQEMPASTLSSANDTVDSPRNRSITMTTTTNDGDVPEEKKKAYISESQFTTKIGSTPPDSRNVLYVSLTLIFFLFVSSAVISIRIYALQKHLNLEYEAIQIHLGDQHQEQQYSGMVHPAGGESTNKKDNEGKERVRDYGNQNATKNLHGSFKDKNDVIQADPCDVTKKCHKHCHDSRNDAGGCVEWSTDEDVISNYDEHQKMLSLTLKNLENKLESTSVEKLNEMIEANIKLLNNINKSLKNIKSRINEDKNQ